MRLNIPVMIFEDQVLVAQDEVLAQVAMPHVKTEMADLSLEYEWHREWNHLGKATADELAIDTRKIDSLPVLKEAMDFAGSGKLGSAVLFIDMRFGDLQVQPEYCTQEFSEFYNGIDDAVLQDGAESAASRCATSLSTYHRHGLLLAYKFIANESVQNVDIWLASLAVETDSLARKLQRFADICDRGVRVLNANGSVARSTKEDRAALVARFARSFDTFAERFRGANLWPTALAEFTDLAKWFHKDHNVAPEHACHQFEEVQAGNKRAYKNALSVYLAHVTGRTEFPDLWFSNKGLHETLKRIVGGDAMAHHGQKLPSLGSIALLVAAAEKTKKCIPPSNRDWLMRFVFSESATVPIIHSSFERNEVRKALINLHVFFEHLMPKDARNESTVVDGAWTQRGTNNVDHLELTFRLSCLTPDTGRDHALLEKITNLKWWSPDGNTTQAYSNFRDSFCPSPKMAKLSVSLYPRGTRDEITCFDFKALSDP